MYRLICTMLAASLAWGCGSTLKADGDGNTDTATDSPVDSAADTAMDEGFDPGDDTAVDSSPDTATDTATDEGIDTGTDPGTDPGLPCDQHIGTFTPGQSEAGVWAAGPDWPEGWEVQGSISASLWDAPFSVIRIESWAGEYGGPMDPFTYTFTEWESYETCGLCLFLTENCNWTGGGSYDCDHTYMIDTGTVTVDTLERTEGGRLQGSMIGAYFIETNGGGTRLTEGGLSYCVDLWEFDETFENY